MFRIIRLGLQQGGVIRHAALDEFVILGILPLVVFPVDENTLDVGVTLSAGVAGVIDPLGKGVDAAQAGDDGFHLKFGELRRLVEEDDIVFHAL